MKILVMSVVLMLGVVACDKHPQEKPPAASGPTNAAQVVSGPFSIQELKDFTALDPKADVADGGDATVVLREVLDLDHGMTPQLTYQPKILTRTGSFV